MENVIGQRTSLLPLRTPACSNNQIRASLLPNFGVRIARGEQVARANPKTTIIGLATRRLGTVRLQE
eukprot:11182119-Lingulodinium_polyedra.AAC.1